MASGHWPASGVKKSLGLKKGNAREKEEDTEEAEAEAEKKRNWRINNRDQESPMASDGIEWHRMASDGIEWHPCCQRHI